VIVDTTFLIDLERELRRRTSGPVAAFLREHGSMPVGVSVVAAAELSEGYEDAGRIAVERLLGSFELLTIDPETSWIWSRLSRQSRAEGRSVGDNDLWIAATAARHARPLVTRNTRDFERLPGVVALSY
jgi:predicted nucleic acid-binding protein